MDSVIDDIDGLTHARHAAADAEWMGYDLGPGVASNDQSGLEWTGDGQRMERTVYLDLGDGAGHETRGRFVVDFRPGSATVLGAVVSVDGEDLGSRGTTP